MSSKASEKTDMATAKPSENGGEMLSKESVKKPDKTGQVTKTLGTESAQPRTKKVNGRRFTFRMFDSNGFMLPADKDWTDEDGNSEAWWEKKSLLRDWIYGRMSPEEFDFHFPYYSGTPKEWYKITKEAHAMPQEEQEPSGLKESDELCTQRYANYYGDGSGLPLRPGMGMTAEELQEMWEEMSLKPDCVPGHMSAEELDASFPASTGPKDGFSGEKEEVSDVRSSHSSESDDEWGPEAYFQVMDTTETMLRQEYFACLAGDDGDLPPQPSMGPSKTEEAFEEEPTKENDEEKPRYAQRYGDGSGLPLRPGMGPPKTKEEFEAEYKKIEAEEDKIFNMSEEEFNVEFSEYKDMPKYFCTDHESWRIMEECDEAEARKGCHSTEEEAEELLEGDDNEQPRRYASSYGDGSGLPLRPGMGPPLTEKRKKSR